MKTWKELQTNLDMIFEHKHIKNKKIKELFSNYEMSKEEIVSELEKAGYTVEVSGDSFIVS